MPLVTVKVFENEFNTAQKAQIIQQVTEAMVSSIGEAVRPATWVLVEEIKSGDWGVGGHGLTLEEVQAANAAK
jgi:4-oxalocrotonate tautomerase